MIRVLEVLATLKRAGAETLVSSLLSRFNRQQFECGLVTLFDSSPGDLEAEVRELRIPLWRLGKRPGLDMSMYGKLRRVMNEFRPDIVHTHSYVMRYTYPVMQGRGVHTVHNLADKEVDRIGRVLHWRAWKAGVQPVAVSGVVARTFAEVYRFLPPVIRNGIDVKRFVRAREVRSAWRQTHGFSETDLLVASVARLEPQKNPVRLAESLPRHCHLLLVGEGSLRSELEGRERVHLLGVRSDIPDILAGADVFALASDYEGHPLALMEAMAAGLPVVATPVGGVPEIVADAGVLVEPAELGQGIEEALRRRPELGDAARHRAREQFDIDVTVRQYEALFQHVMQARPS